MPGSRLECALGLMPNGGVLADVGAGDGLLARRLAERAGVCQVFATEYGEGPFGRLAAACSGIQKLTLRRGDGLVPLTGEPLDGVAVLGMGGRTILKILDIAHAFPRAVFVLGPMQATAALRLGLAERGLAIRDERLVLQSGRPYPLIVAAEGEGPHLTALDAMLGPVLRHTRPQGFGMVVERERQLLAAKLRFAGEAERGIILGEIAALEAEESADN